MSWYHKVSREWQVARKKFLTASEIVNLLPLTPTGRPRDIEQFKLDIWADKQARVTDYDLESRGVMARGHLLESYAINEFNNAEIANERLYHWDDALIHDGRMAYSPDALSVNQLSLLPSYEFPNNMLAPRTSGEVKCYTPKSHYATALADKMELQERWQIASGFYVSESLEESYLLLFNPSCSHPLFYHHYERAEFAIELGMIGEIVEDFYASTLELSDQFNRLGLPSSITENEIIALLEQEPGNILRSIINPS